jgi:hypothetical protein
MTFYVRTGSAELNKSFKEVFVSKGYTFSSKFPVDVVFLAGEAAYYRNHEDLKKSGFVNVIKRPDITHKALLYKKFKNEPFIPKSANYPCELPDTFLKILKPADGFAGEGIQIVKTQKEAEEWIASNNYSDWVIQDYIKTPALKNGHKFHLRVHVLVVDDLVFLYKNMRYYVAKKQYVQDNWKDLDIHDTHYNPDFNFMYPKDLPDGWESSVNLKNMIHKVFDGIKLKPDWNGKKAYYIFGLDILFNKKRPILLEVNDRVGLTEKAAELIEGVISILRGIIPDSFERII